MSLSMARVMIFAKDMKRMTRFYETVVGLPRLATPDDSEDFVSFDAGGCQLCLHVIPPPWGDGVEIAEPAQRRWGGALKVAFYATDVAALRAELVGRGAAMDEVERFDGLHLCDGIDPEGNIFQISNR
jgi:catechol 2,3-dioxygenase-like lactoylglutathione lyase family enzyme